VGYKVEWIIEGSDRLPELINEVAQPPNKAKDSLPLLQNGDGSTDDFLNPLGFL
jgi:hypothetical protein